MPEVRVSEVLKDSGDRVMQVIHPSKGVLVGPKVGELVKQSDVRQAQYGVTVDLPDDFIDQFVAGVLAHINGKAEKFFDAQGFILSLAPVVS